jgi:DNA replication protein DnaC
MKLTPLTPRQLKRVRVHKKYDPDKCPTCENEGEYYYNDEYHACDCATQKRLQRRYIAANIGSRYHNLTFDDVFDDFREVAEAVKDYVDNFEDNAAYGRGLTFTGPLGTGKSFAASLILKELIKKGHDCFFIEFDDLLHVQAQGWNDLDNEEFYEIRNAEVLVIDELTTEPDGKKKDLLSATLERVIRYRVNNSLPTIITTNLTAEQEASAYPRVASLLATCQTRYSLDGDDQRKKNARSTNQKLIKQSARRPIS